MLAYSFQEKNLPTHLTFFYLRTNIFPILGGFFVNNVDVRVTIFARLTTKQNVMKKAKYLIFDRLERNCFEKW